MKSNMGDFELSVKVKYKCLTWAIEEIKRTLLDHGANIHSISIRPPKSIGFWRGKYCPVNIVFSVRDHDTVRIIEKNILKQYGILNDA